MREYGSARIAAERQRATAYNLMDRPDGCATALVGQTWKQAPLARAQQAAPVLNVRRV